MRKEYKYLLIVLLSFFALIMPLSAESKASSQFKSYDKRNDSDGAVDYKYHANEASQNVKSGGIVNNALETTIGVGVDKGLSAGAKYAQNASQKYIQNVQKYVSNNMPAQRNFKNFKDYQNAVRNLRNAENKAIQRSQNLANNTGKVLNGAGKAYSGIMLAKDIAHLNDESKHRHSSLKQLALTTRYMKVLYGGGALANKGLEGAATASSYLNDADESDEFVDWANKQDNEFLDALDDITDKVNDKAYRDACQILEWLGINPPNSLPALRTAIKPNIYLYPEEETEILTTFDSPELLLTVIPDYKNGWLATVKPNGEMTVEGEKYGYLFYESMTSEELMQKEEGFIVPTKNRIEFLTEVSNFYGFNDQETKDFVEFWNGRLDTNKKYVMYPQTTKTIDILMPVKINPSPKSIFRIWFLFNEMEEEISIKKPKEVKAKREGYTMVEWGGIVAE